MASIFTRKGEEILIDDEDLDFVSQFTWCLDGTGYPVTHKPGTKSKRIHLHSLLRHTERGQDVDHVNRNKCDARQENLETISHASNIRRQEKSPCSGVRAYHNKFKAYITVNDRQVHLGSYKTFDLALLARIIGEIRYWGEVVQTLP